MASNCTLKSTHAIYTPVMFYFWFSVDLESWPLYGHPELVTAALYYRFCFILLYPAFLWIKLFLLGNWVLLFPTHPSWISFHFIGLACFSISLEKSLMLLLIREVLEWFGKWFSHLWGFIIFSLSMIYELAMSFLPSTQISFIRMYYHCNNINYHLFIIN